MTDAAQIVRAQGCTLRVTILNAHAQYGEGVGLTILERMLWEIGENGAEIHGTVAMADLMYAAADDMIAGRGAPEVLERVPSVIDLTGPNDEDDPVEGEKVLTGTESPLTASRASATPTPRLASFLMGLAVGAASMWYLGGVR